MKKPLEPKYYRQKFLLALLDLAGGKLSKMDFQKLLFLSQQGLATTHYNFIPYHYGCYSFHAQSDIELMEQRGWLEITDKQIMLRAKPEAKLSSSDLSNLDSVLHQYKNYRGKKLIKHIYERYPYYAIKSRIAEDVLDQSGFKAIEQLKNELKNNRQELLTIGYEGLSFEQYVNRLIEHDVKLLCDVRRNPLSRKFGFSKGTLSQVLPKIGIEYRHIPELGICSENRQELNTKADYERLFKTYKKTLPQKESYLEILNQLLNDKKRVAITCFEKEPEFCHRHCISDHITITKKTRVVHL